MFKTYFESNDLIILIFGISIAAIAVFYQEIKENNRTSLLLLLLSALILRVFVANLDPFFNIWDEQYHALVAKNMLSHPFKPLLYSNPALPYDYQNWTRNSIWLHKQPLFLWQIALSFKIFGLGFFTARIPSVIMSTIIVFFVYDIAKHLFGSKVGFYAALLMCSQNYILLLVSGFLGTDHNDIAFLFYVTASIWAFVRYHENNSLKWVIWIGIFAGMAVLNKWLTGLIVYFTWFCTISFSSNRRDKRLYLNLLTSLLVCIAVFLPWQLYILYKFPIESHWEFLLNSLHFSQAVESHSDNFWFHFKFFDDIYGNLMVWIVPLGLIVLYLKFRKSNNSIVFSLFLTIVLIYVFFGIAKTKMYSFTIILSPLIIIIAAFFINYTLSYLRLNLKLRPLLFKSVSMLLLIILFIYSLNIERIQKVHTDIDEPMKYGIINRLRSYHVITQLSDILQTHDCVLFNLFPDQHIITMIFTDYTAYDFIPTMEQIAYLKKGRRQIAIFDNDLLPAFLINDTAIIKIRSEMWYDTTYKKPEIYH